MRRIKVCFILTVVLMAAVSTSCTKKGDYHCICDVNENGSVAHWSNTYPDVKKSDAKQDCQGIEDRFNARSHVSAVCTLE